MTRSEALVIRAFAVWTVWVWGTRIGNVIGDDDRSFAFKAVHVTLAAVSVLFAIAAWVVVRRGRRRASPH
jgi:predicted branched-subunit amino acid permease